MEVGEKEGRKEGTCSITLGGRGRREQTPLWKPVKKAFDMCVHLLLTCMSLYIGHTRDGLQPARPYLYWSGSWEQKGNGVG